MVATKRFSRVRSIAIAAVLVAPALVLGHADPRSGGNRRHADDDGPRLRRSAGQRSTRRTGSRSVPSTDLTNVDEVAGGREHVLALVGGQVYSMGRRLQGRHRSEHDQRPLHADPGRRAVRGHQRLHRALPLARPAGRRHGPKPGASTRWASSATARPPRRTRPVTVRNLSNVVDIVAGRDMSYALLADGTVRSWGGGVNGELGNGTHDGEADHPGHRHRTDGRRRARRRPQPRARARADGTIWLGAWAPPADSATARRRSRTTPVQVSGITTAVAVAAGADHSVALLANGQVMTWGEASRGQLGLGNTTDRTDAEDRDRAPGHRAHRLWTRHHARRRAPTGELWDWGYNDFGQLGDGTLTRRSCDRSRSRDHQRDRGTRRPRLHGAAPRRLSPTSPGQSDDSVVSRCPSRFARSRRGCPGSHRWSRS